MTRVQVQVSLGGRSARGRLWIVGKFVIGLTDHLEGPRDQPSGAIFDDVADLVRLADRLGVQYAWFSEHHAHAHHGHLPAPMLLRCTWRGRPSASTSARRSSA